MSQQYDNNNQGILNKNEKKTEDWQAILIGSATVDGVDYFVDMTQMERKDGSGKFYKLKFKRKDMQKPAAPKAAQKPVKAGHGFEDMDSDVPFRDPMARKGFHLAV